MKKSIAATERELVRIRTGKATPNLLDGIKVDHYTNMVPISQTSTISVPEPRMIVIQPWEKKMIPEIVKAIMKSDLGLNPSAEGNIIRLPIPPLNEDRRKERGMAVQWSLEFGDLQVKLGNLFLRRHPF